nr:proteasomal ubiquitin receptor ADRM1 [Arenicola marina]
MATGALFGSSASGRSQSKNLVEFRAGKMQMKGNMVHPDKRKGQFYVYQSDDALMHLCWKDRTKGTVEDDLIIFPDDVEFKHVAKCTTGRVYLVKFKASTRKMFFWMQEPKSDKDEENCRKVNEYLNNPPTPGSSRGGGSSSGLGNLSSELAAGLGGSELHNLLGNMSQQELMQLLGGMGMGGMGGLSALMGGRPGSGQSDSNPPSRVQSSPGPRATAGSASTPTSQATESVTPRPVTASALPSQTPQVQPAAVAATPVTPAPSAAPPTPGAPVAPARSSSIQLQDLQNILSGLGGAALSESEPMDLACVITPDALIPILSNPEAREGLLPFLPEGDKLPRTEAELRNTVQSPQFQQALQSFSAALASGQLGPLMSQFDLGEAVANAAAQGDVPAFARAMQEQLAAKKAAEGAAAADKDGDAEMKDEEKK